VTVVPLHRPTPTDDTEESGVDVVGPGDVVGAAEAAPARRGRGRGRRLVGLLVVALLAAAVAVAVVQWQRANDLDGDITERRDVATAASTFASALLSYDAEDLTAARDRVTSLATADFAAEYATAFDEGLSTVINELDAVSTATVRDVFVAEVSGSSARAIVVVDSSVESSAGVRDLTGSYLQIELQQADDRWLVSAVSAVGAEDESLSGSAPAPGG
jgi:Mce-associated membrane protein